MHGYAVTQIETNTHIQTDTNGYGQLNRDTQIQTDKYKYSQNCTDTIAYRTKQIDTDRNTNTDRCTFTDRCRQVNTEADR